MRQNRSTFILAVAVLSAAATGVVGQWRLKAVQDQAEALQRQLAGLKPPDQSGPSLAEQQRMQVFFRGQHDSMALAASQAQEAERAALRVRLAREAALPGPGQAAAREALRRCEDQSPFFSPDELQTSSGGLMFIDGTEYDLPLGGPRLASGQPGEQAVQVGHQTLLVHQGELIWDGTDYGRVPPDSRVKLGADGRVLVNGVARPGRPAPAETVTRAAHPASP